MNAVIRDLRRTIRRLTKAFVSYRKQADEAGRDYWKHFSALRFPKARGAQEAEVAMTNRAVDMRRKLAQAILTLKVARQRRRKHGK